MNLTSLKLLKLTFWWCLGRDKEKTKNGIIWQILASSMLSRSRKRQFEFVSYYTCVFCTQHFPISWITSQLELANKILYKIRTHTPVCFFYLMRWCARLLHCADTSWVMMRKVERQKQGRRTPYRKRRKRYDIKNQKYCTICLQICHIIFFLWPSQYWCQSFGNKEDALVWYYSKGFCWSFEKI